MSTKSNDDPTCDSTEGDKNAFSCLQHRIRNLVAALGGASRLARQLADEFGDPIGESGIRAWTAQGNVPLRRRHQLARLGQKRNLVVDLATLEVHFDSIGGDVSAASDPGKAAFFSLDQVAARWGVPRDRVEDLVKFGSLRVHDLAGTERVAYSDLADFEFRARRSDHLDC
ncbi:hypothetical protein E2C06_12400 [Dankookia rubra]|uniref:Uncharacterized protein n=1 Tax=Dankookia rubra TaxID=1442381 RepID=A0A4R5QIC5_9PROT|nr:hypothetical protein [Dankookia rubra]TDH62401.1 hypothetical protein E2C06_12400 [Dankookia rubra]